MKKYSKVFAIALALILVISLAACSGGGGSTPEPTPEPAPAPAPAPADEPEQASGVNEFGIPYPNADYRVVFTMFNGANPVAREIEIGFVGAADSIDLNLWVMDNELDPIKMNSNADMAIAAGDVDFYVLYTNHLESNPQIMTKLTEAGIPVLTIGTDAIAEDGTTAPVYFSAQDNYDSAYLAAESLAKAAQAKGWTEDECVFLEMGFDEAGGVFLIRNEGAYAGMQSVFPNIEIIDSSSEGDAEVAHRKTTDVLTNYPDKKILGWTHSDDVTGSMMAAIQTAGRGDGALLVSNGLNMAMLDMLRESDGIIVGSIDLFFTQWGYEILTMVIAYLNDGTPIPPVNNAPYRLITPDNVGEIFPN